MAAWTPAARELFRELVGISGEERESILSNRQIPMDIRREVQSLLRYDAQMEDSLTGRVSAVAKEVLVAAPSPGYCGPYRLVKLLGRGGMGSVYLGERHDGEIEQKVAIKLLRPDVDGPVYRDRFLRERQLLAYLNHPSIARLLGAGRTEDGRPYLVMEFVEGVAIDEYSASLDLRSRLQLFLVVCDGVAHAHRHLIIHRDLKPSNILVDASGHPKLLDFGIAKLLDVTTDETRTVDRVLTPHYASPEQRRGEVQTTATDVYSLGAVLHKLLTGRSPNEPRLDDSPEVPAKLPRDIDYILRKALRQEPSERYPSMDAFAEDIRAFLESRPVHARCGNAWYHTRKFVRRYRVGVAAAVIAVAGLLAGLQIANHQRAIAQQRFLQVRHLANRVLALDKAIGGLDNSTKARHEIVDMSKSYLEALGAEAHKDPDLAIEVGESYTLLARVQGMSFAASPNQQVQAEESLRRANAFVEPILSANPANRKALLIAARIHQHRMILSQARRLHEETALHARKSAGYLDQLRAQGELSEAEGDTIAQLYYDISLTCKNLRLLPDSVRYARNSVDVARFLPSPQLRMGHGLSMLANALRLTADLDGGLKAIHEAKAQLGAARFPSERVRRLTWALTFSREAKILAAPSGISLDRPDEAIALYQKAFNLIEDLTQEDEDDAWSRLLFASLGREFGDVVRFRDPLRALQVYDHAILRLREVTNNPEARRGEAEIIAASSFAARQLRRFDDSRQRIDTAFRLLRETADYPAARVVPHEPAEIAVRALADHYADTGSPHKAVDVYQTLLEKVMRSGPDPQNDLGHAMLLSQIYASLAELHRRVGEETQAEAVAALRSELWRQWDQKLPRNGLIHRQVELARL